MHDFAGPLKLMTAWTVLRCTKSSFIVLIYFSSHFGLSYSLLLCLNIFFVSLWFVLLASTECTFHLTSAHFTVKELYIFIK